MARPETDEIPERGGSGKAAAVVVAALLAASAAAWWLLGGKDPALEPPAIAPPQAEVAAAPAPPPAERVGSGGADAERTEPAPASAADEAERDQTAEPGAPRFDIVRIEPSGSGLVAGTAAPGAEIEVRVDGEIVGRAQADSDGAFVALVRTTPGVALQRLTVALAETPSLAPDAVEEQVFVVAGETPEETPLVVQPTDSGLDVLQGPPRPQSDIVTLDTITYDSDGGVALSGRAPAGAEVRVYLDERSIGVARAEEDGVWRFRPAERVAPGDYRLRVDEVAASGAVASRVETPFRRESVAPGEVQPESLVVQRGDSLWRIAESVYGEGLRYTLIYEANDGAIRDPDLIYPGQIFRLPQEYSPE